MNRRPVVDNDLLLACDKLHAGMAKFWGFMTFAAVGASWYLLVALRA